MSKLLWGISDLSNEQVSQLLELAAKMQSHRAEMRDLCHGEILGMMFMEPSTRTYFSFESAMQRLGGQTLGFAEASSTSAAKGETLADAVTVMAGYADALVLRQSEAGIGDALAHLIDIPLINGGDGVGEHPTQTLTDLYTINQAHQRLDVKIALYGDLKFGRTNHSLLLASARFGATIYCIAPDALQMPSSLVDRARQQGAEVICGSDITEVISAVDVLYVTRLQRERLPESARDVGDYGVDEALVSRMKVDSIIMHPLPRVDELSVKVDKDSRARYFQQVANGVPVRMALLATMLGKKV